MPASEHQSSRGNSSEKMSKSVSARTERVISKARTVAFLFEASLPLHERGNVTSRTGGITMGQRGPRYTGN